MKVLQLLTIALLGSFLIIGCDNGDGKETDNLSSKIELRDNPEAQQIEVVIDGAPFTNFSYSDTLMKPILYPISTIGGNFITRGWPIDPREGEQTDHPHHKGMWLNYGDVNGYDFWNNSSTIPAQERAVKYGRIKHQKIESIISGDTLGKLVTLESWQSPYGNELLSERTSFNFYTDGNARIIDRITTLKADSTIIFGDIKEGMFGIRFNRHLHLPSQKAQTYIDAMGNETTVSPDSKDATGNYLSSEGITGDDVWGTRARWVDLYGNINGEDVSLVIIDHPKNFDYPTYWHARGYGLFAANPFGAYDFTEGKRRINYSMNIGDSITFRYRTIINSGGHLSPDEIEQFADSFSSRY